MHDVCDDYGFRFLDNVAHPPIQLVSVGKQSRYNKKYYYDNSKRSPAYLFQYTLGGSGTLKTKEKTYILEKGDAFFLQIPDDTIYYFDEANNHAPWELIYILFNGACIDEYYNYVTNRFGQVLHLSEHHPAIRKIFEIYLNAKNGQLKNAFSADKEAFNFLCLLCANEEGNTHSQLPLVECVKDYLETNFDKPLSLFSAAEHLGISQSHLSREFIKYTGEQPIKYLTKIRLEKAINMLCSTEMNLEQISLACGFGDGNYFSKVFKKYMKLSPGEFRKQMKIQGYKNVRI